MGTHKEDGVFKHQERMMLNKIMSFLDNYWKQRDDFYAKSAEAIEHEAEQKELDNEIERISNFIELGLLCVTKDENQMNVLYATIENLIKIHNAKA